MPNPMKDYLASVRIECRLRAGEIEGGHKQTEAGISMRALTLADIEEIVETKIPAHFPRNTEGSLNLLKLFPKVILKGTVEGAIWQSIYDQGRIFATDIARQQALRDAGEMFENFDMFRVEQALDLANNASESGANRLPAFESVSDEDMLIMGGNLISVVLTTLRATKEPISNRRHWEAVRRVEEAETYLKLIRMGHATFRDTREISLPPEEVNEDAQENTLAD